MARTLTDQTGSNMKQQHTPRPWKQEGRGTYLKVIFSGEIPGTRPAVCVIMDGTEAEREANARLIAAAPDLLEATRTLISILDVGFPEVQAKLVNGGLLLSNAKKIISEVEGCNEEEPNE